MLNKLYKSKSCGPNSIPTNLLRNHDNAFVLPLKLAINQSFSEGKFPDLLKIAKVCPVFKKGQINLRENYRPITLIAYLSKIFERAMHTRLYAFLILFMIYNMDFGKNTLQTTLFWALLKKLDKILTMENFLVVFCWSRKIFWYC